MSNACTRLMAASPVSERVCLCRLCGRCRSTTAWPRLACSLEWLLSPTGKRFRQVRLQVRLRHSRRPPGLWPLALRPPPAPGRGKHAAKPSTNADRCPPHLARPYHGTCAATGPMALLPVSRCSARNPERSPSPAPAHTSECLTCGSGAALCASGSAASPNAAHPARLSSCAAVFRTAGPGQIAC